MMARWWQTLLLGGVVGLQAAAWAEEATAPADAPILHVVIRDSVRTFAQGGSYANNDRARLHALREAFESSSADVEDFPYQLNLISFPKKAPRGEPYLQVILLDWRMRVTGEYEARLSATFYANDEKEKLGLFVGREAFMGNPSIRSVWEKHRLAAAEEACAEIIKAVLPRAETALLSSAERP